MRGILLLTAIILLAPIVTATTLGPDQWRATGSATWGEDPALASSASGNATRADAICDGTLRAGALGPMPAGPHKGEYRFWVDAAADDDRCDFRREGWISDPYSDANQIFIEDGASGTMVTFRASEEGERTLIITEWDDRDPNDPYRFLLTGAIREHHGAFQLETPTMG